MRYKLVSKLEQCFRQIFQYNQEILILRKHVQSIFHLFSLVTKKQIDKIAIDYLFYQD